MTSIEGRSSRRRRALPGLALGALLVIVTAAAAGSFKPKTVLVSAGLRGASADNHSGGQSISANGRFVAFASDAANLVPRDSNDDRDVFVRDLKTGSLERVSVSSGGAQANGPSLPTQVDLNGGVAISADGRFVAFASQASNLVGGDSNRAQDVFVRDRLKHRTRLVSQTAARKPGNGSSLHPALSRDGRFVAFASAASDLVGGDGNAGTDIFLRDLVTGRTRRVSVSSSGAEGDGACFRPSVTPGGEKVAFECTSGNLVAGDSNGVMDVFVRDVARRKTVLVSAARSGGAGDEGSFSGGQPSISPDGRLVVFDSSANNLVAGDGGDAFDAFVRDLRTAKTRRLSVSPAGAAGNDDTGLTTLSPDGVWVAFESGASNLVSGDSNASFDVFVRRLASGPIRRVSVSTSGEQGNLFSDHPALSDGGRTAVFESIATNFSPADGDPFVDVFVRRLLR